VQQAGRVHPYHNMNKRIIAIYPGRFQPFSKHHYSVYKWIVQQFGENNTYIATSNVVSPPKSPLNFNEKKLIMKAYGIPENKIVNCKSPYKPEEILRDFKSKDTAVVFIVGSKDMDVDPRFKITPTSYFQKYNSNAALKGYEDAGYIVTAPHIKTMINNKELSGTYSRELLSSGKPIDVIMKSIFGFYNKGIGNMLQDKFKMKESAIFTKNWWNSIINEVIVDSNKSTDSRILLTCGGAAGHMLHPFELDNVNTGKDLIDVFKKSAKWLQSNTASVKIDGVNASIRLVTVNGKKQFVLDRGSNKPLDVVGVTADTLKDRFPAGHGMIGIGKTVLTIFNSSLSAIKSPLKKLGLLDNPNILLNIEFVSGQTNVMAYDHDFITIHGLLEVTKVGNRRVSKEIPFDKSAMNELVQALTAKAMKFGYKVYHEIPTTNTTPPNFNKALNKPITVVYSKTKKETKSLKNWLNTLTIPTDVKIDWNGASTYAISKKVLTDIDNGVEISKATTNSQDAESAVAGYITYMATILLGDVILESLDSPLGGVQNQEGIVIRASEISPSPFKITGKFILGGLSSKFRK